MPIERGEVYFVNLNPIRGREQAGRRPVVVVSNDTINKKPLVVAVVPGTKGDNVKTDLAWNVRVAAGEANLPEETVFLTFQVRALDHSRFRDPPIGRLSPEQLARIDKALARTLSIAP